MRLALLLLPVASALAQDAAHEMTMCGARIGLDQGLDQFVCSSTPAVVSRPSPFSPDCNGTQRGTNYRNAPTEPWVAIDPSNPLHLLGAWQQDRWADGGSSGLLTGASFDGGRNWSISSARFSTCTGGSYDRASDPWVDFSPDGTAHQVALTVSNYGANGPNTRSAVLVSRSTDGGLSWSDPVTLISDGAAAFNDKESITADAFDSNYVYVVWDRSSGSTKNNTYRQPVWFARTTDGGLTWEPGRVIYDPGANSAAIGNHIVVLPDGSLLDLFLEAFQINTNQSPAFLAVIRSTDRGVTWSDPVIISDQQANGVLDLKTKKGIRAGTGLPSIAADPQSGAVYVTWEDSRFNHNLRDGIVLSRSTDGGQTWSAPVAVNQAPLVQAFEPAIAVGRDGTVAVDYFDFRKDTDDPAVLWTSAWRIESRDGGNTWQEFSLLPPFNLLDAPATAGYFLGDYHAIVSMGTRFLSFLVIANPPGAATENSVVAIREPRLADTSTISREQIYLNRYHPHPHEEPSGKPRP